jgi:hypothetical protein
MAAKKKTSTGNGASAANAANAKVQKIATGLSAIATQIAALGLPSLTAEERATASGRLRGGEDVALLAILDTMDAFPAVFQSLAAKDFGTDDTAVETAPSRAALAQGEALQALVATAQQLAQSLSDAVLAAFTQVKEVTVPAYAIGKASAVNDAAVRKVLAPALDFYGAQSRRRTIDKKVKATKAAKAAKKSPSSTA